jgi:hypothetical protein
MNKKIKFKDINCVTHSIIAADVEQFSHFLDEQNLRDCVQVEINGETIFADCHLLDFTRAWNAAIAT